MATLDESGDGYAVTTVDLSVRGRVPDLDQKKFEKAAKEAEEACPISNAIRGNVTINLEATLEQ